MTTATAVVEYQIAQAYEISYLSQSRDRLIKQLTQNWLNTAPCTINSSTSNARRQKGNRKLYRLNLKDKTAPLLKWQHARLLLHVRYEN